MTQDQIAVPANFITEHLLDGNVTVNLVVTIFSCVSVAVLVTLWVVYRFQTKSEARDSELRHTNEAKALEDRLSKALERETSLLKTDIESIHNHMHSMREDLKDDQSKLQDEVTFIRNMITQQGVDLAYIKGRLEPKP